PGDVLDEVAAVAVFGGHGAPGHGVLPRCDRWSEDVDARARPCLRAGYLGPGAATRARLQSVGSMRAATGSMSSVDYAGRPPRSATGRLRGDGRSARAPALQDQGGEA